MTIDSFGFTDVDFIKIDTELYLMPVLHGMKQTLINNSPVLQIEVRETGNKGKVEAELKFLTDLGYTRYYIYKQDDYYRK